MGLVYTTLDLKNPRNENKRFSGKALVDTGALHLCIPEHIALQLELDELQKREVTCADGSRKLCPYVGPIEVSFENRSCYTGALVLGDEILLGAVPMEDMDLIVSPAKRTIIANPENPNIPASIVKNFY